MFRFFIYTCFFLITNSILHCDIYNGLVFYSNSQGFGSSKTFLMNSSYQYINTWSHPSGVVGIPHLFQDGSIIVQTRSQSHSFGGSHGPIGGVFEKLDWSGNVIWSIDFYSDSFHPHHDIEVMTNGNILVLSWEKKTLEEAQGFGRQNIINQMWPLVIYEIQPIENDSAIVVWEWHAWDHLIQDVDPNLPNYGSIYYHPELLDINIGNFTTPTGGDWMHTNAIAYNESLDQIVFSSRHFNEIFIIDHSTTTEEASGHVGGISGKGGDILYRWGNPMNYNRGTIENQMLNAQHGVHWIPSYMPGEGNLIIYNNNPTDTTGQDNSIGNSSVVEICPPINSLGLYEIESDSAFGPTNYDWKYGGDSTFFSNFQSGAYRIENGNTIITVTQGKYIFEIDSLGQIVWEFFHENIENNNGYTARAKKYSLNYLESRVGDVNFDHLINIYDIIEVIEFWLENDYRQLADFNSDSIIDNFDLDILIGLIIN